MTDDSKGLVSSAGGNSLDTITKLSQEGKLKAAAMKKFGEQGNVVAAQQMLGGYLGGMQQLRNAGLDTEEKQLKFAQAQSVFANMVDQFAHAASEETLQKFVTPEFWQAIQQGVEEGYLTLDEASSAKDWVRSAILRVGKTEEDFPWPDDEGASMHSEASAALDVRLENEKRGLDYGEQTPSGYVKEFEKALQGAEDIASFRAAGAAFMEACSVVAEDQNRLKPLMRDMRKVLEAKDGKPLHDSANREAFMLGITDYALRWPQSAGKVQAAIEQCQFKPFGPSMSLQLGFGGLSSGGGLPGL